MYVQTHATYIKVEKVEAGATFYKLIFCKYVGTAVGYQHGIKQSVSDRNANGLTTFICVQVQVKSHT